MTGTSGDGHSHTHADPPDVPVRPLARVVLLAGLALAAAATVVGLVVLWPSGDVREELPDNAFVAPGVTFEKARVDRVAAACPPEQQPGQDASGSGPTDPAGPVAPEGCGVVEITLLTGDNRGDGAELRVPTEVSRSGLAAGDRLEVLQLPASSGGGSPYSFFAVDRDLPLALLALFFVVVVGVVARLRGLLALVGLVFGGYVLAGFMLPALLAGSSGLAVALVGASAIMFVVLYLAHGPSIRTSAALAGTLVGVALSALIGVLAIQRNRLAGVSDDTGAMLSSFVGGLDPQGLLTCAVIVAGLGVLNDVTITQASAVWELRAASPSMDRWRLYGSAMRIGRDHIASTIYTIVFAYAGASLSVLLLLYFYERPVLSLVGTEQIAEEVVRTLASGIGLVLAVPVTTAIAVLTVAGATPGRHEGGERSVQASA